MNGKEKSAWDWQMLVSLGVNEKMIRQSNPRDQQVLDIVKGILYLKARYPSYWK